MAKQRFSYGGFCGVVVLSITLLFFNNYLLGTQHDDFEPVPYKIFTLKHISAEQGRKYLSEAGIGTVSHISGTSALLVTAPDSELAKVRSILNFVDGQEQFSVRAVYPSSPNKKLPSNKSIEEKVGNVSVGSFSAPPTGNTKARVMIDIHNDKVIIIAPGHLMDRIVSAAGLLPTSLGNHSAPSTIGTAGNWEAPEPTGQALPEKTYFAAQDNIRTKPNTVANMLEQEMAELPVAGGSYEPEPIEDGENTLQLSLPETLPLPEFLGFVGEHLQLSYLYDPAKVTGNVTIRPHGRLRGPIKLKELYPLLESVLQFHGFAMTRRGDLITIVPVAEAQNIDPELYPDNKTLEMGDAVITSVFKLQHIDTTSAKNFLDAMKLAIDTNPIAETQTLIVTGYAYRMPRIEALLDMLDKPGEPRKFRFRQLQYTMAETLAPKIQTLAEQLGTVTVTIEAEPEKPYTPTPRRSGETNTAYQARIRRERAAAARRRTDTPATQAETGKPAVYLDADERTNRILMIGLSEQLDEVEGLIDTLDVAQQDLRTLELYKIRHVDAEEVKNKLAELGVISASQLTTSYSSRLTDDAKPPATTATTRGQTAVRPRTSTRGLTDDMATEGLEGEPQVAVVRSTNSLLVNATAEQHARIVTIKDYVDRETDEEEIPYRIYPLENQSPEHLATILEPLIQETILDKEGKIEEVVKKQDEQITIVADPNTFSLIVYASKKNQEWVSSLIEKLDQRRPQVLIDVTLVQISKSDAFDYDLNVLSSFPNLIDTSGTTSAILGAIGTIVDGNNAPRTNLVESLLASGRDRFIDFQSASGAGTGFYGDRHINFLLKAMQEKNYGRVLAKPKILVNDNEPGTISTEDMTYVTKQTSTIIEGVQNAVPTSVEYEGYPAGITLDITPHISRGDWLRLDIALTRSDFGTITGEKPPDTTTSQVDTTVTVPDGSTIILGGLMKLNQSKGGTKVPILGDIPIIGGLFRSTSNSDLQRNLYVFVKAEIIRPDEEGYTGDDLRRISDRNREAFEKHEIEFQEYRDWPGAKPKAMEPIRVLDAQ
jgi:general secretion pathway protein D